MGEIGVFVRAINTSEKNRVINDTVLQWNANHLNAKGIKNLIQERDKSNKIKESQEKKPLTKDEQNKINNDWKRLAAAASRGFK